MKQSAKENVVSFCVAKPPAKWVKSGIHINWGILKMWHVYNLLFIYKYMRLELLITPFKNIPDGFKGSQNNNMKI